MVGMEPIALHWDFQDEILNSTTRQINRQKAARNLALIEYDPSEFRAVFFDPDRANTHTATLSTCDCNDFTRLRNRKPCMHIYRLAMELGVIEAKYLDTKALEIQRLQQLLPDPKQWGCWSAEVHACGIQINRQYKADFIYHIERSVHNAANGWMIHGYSLTLQHCECADFSDRRLPCEHIYAAALASNISLPFTYTEFEATRNQEA